MNENPDTDSLPLTDEEIDKLLDEVQARIENQTPEEKAKSKREADAFLSSGPEGQ